MLLVDTNALIDVLEDDPRWADWSIDGLLRRQSQVHRLAINPIIRRTLLDLLDRQALDERR